MAKVIVKRNGTVFMMESTDFRYTDPDSGYTHIDTVAIVDKAQKMQPNGHRAKMAHTIGGKTYAVFADWSALPA